MCIHSLKHRTKTIIYINKTVEYATVDYYNKQCIISKSRTKLHIFGYSFIVLI